jgi:hypothetical protein
MEKFKLTETEKGETGEEQSQGNAHIFFLTSRELFTKDSSWQAKQSIPPTIATFWNLAT